MWILWKCWCGKLTFFWSIFRYFCLILTIYDNKHRMGAWRTLNILTVLQLSRGCRKKTDVLKWMIQLQIISENLISLRNHFRHKSVWPSIYSLQCQEVMCQCSPIQLLTSMSQNVYVLLAFKNYKLAFATGCSWEANSFAGS